MQESFRDARSIGVTSVTPEEAVSGGKDILTEI